jgi:CcmD family protein
VRRSAISTIMKKILSFLIVLLTSTSLFAQEVTMADQMRADGKIWVVVGVITIVFIGIITYLVLLDRKISKIEKNL